MGGCKINDAEQDIRSAIPDERKRQSDSNWSAKKKVHAIRLIEEWRMMPSGLAQVEAARANGRWAVAYVGQSAMTILTDFLYALETHPKAKAFVATLDRKNLYPIYYRLQTAKSPDTRKKRLARILEQLDHEERFY